MKIKILLVLTLVLIPTILKPINYRLGREATTALLNNLQIISDNNIFVQGSREYATLHFLIDMINITCKPLFIDKTVINIGNCLGFSITKKDTLLFITNKTLSKASQFPNLNLVEVAQNIENSFNQIKESME